jgi:hypothetical protein
MGLELPSGLATLLDDLGFLWTQADETVLALMGTGWMGFGIRASEPPQSAQAAAQRVYTASKGAAPDAFRRAANDPAAPHANLTDAATGAKGIGIGLLACAGIVLALKLSVIAQLTALAVEIAQAVATVPLTFGTSLLEIPAFKEVAGMAINLAISIAASAVMGH